MADTKLSMKLLIDNNTKRVLFGEAGKDCVDFLFFILSLPLSTLIRLLGKQGMVGALPNLYESIEKLNDSYIQQDITKETLLQPASTFPGYDTPLLSIKTTPALEKRRSSGRGGFVKEVVTYMVMDDLTVKPMSTISSIALLTQFNINNVSVLEEKVVNMGIDEALKLLKASLVSKNVLTNVFLDGNN